MYTDGSCKQDEDGTLRVGAGVWFSPNNHLNTALRLPVEYQTNQTGEIAGILVAAQKAPPFVTLNIRSDSRSTIDTLTKGLKDALDTGFLQLENAALLRATVATLQRRSAKTTLQWVKGHAGIAGNENADRLADAGASKDAPDELDTTIPPDFNLTGIKLARMTQALAYKTMRSLAKRKPRGTTERNLKRIKDDVLTTAKTALSTQTIWASIRHTDVTRKISDFLWNGIHGTQKLGSFWTEIPGYEDRAKCPRCEVPETLEHILMDCERRPRKTIWMLTEKLWCQKYPRWPEMKYGTILGIGSISLNHVHGCSTKAVSRLYRILVSEGAHLIWRMRCEHRISRGDDPAKEHMGKEIFNRWKAIVNQRLHLDRTMTDETLSTRAIDKDMVLQTWSGLLQDEGRLPDDWTKESGVLVGIRR